MHPYLGPANIEMIWREFWSDVLNVAIFIIYPAIELYGYFVFIGLFCLEDTKFDSWAILVLFLAYHMLETYKIIFYMRLLITEGMSTLDIFPDVPQGGYDLKLQGINKFVEEKVMRQNMAKVKICSTCKTYKPPRAHHCTACRRCYLRYDHHCSLLNTCIGFHNYKFFYQFMAINLVSTLFFLVTIFIYVLAFEHTYRSHTINYIVSMSLLGVEFVFNLALLIFHTGLIGMNETTIEYYTLSDYINGDYSFNHVFQEGPIVSLATSKDRKVLNPYNLSPKQNWLQIFGNNPWDWLRPTFSTAGDGITFPKNYDEYELL